MKRASAWVVCILAATFLSAIPQSAHAIVGPTISCSGATCTATFSDTSSVYSWSVPAGVTSISVVLKGGKGGNGYGGGSFQAADVGGNGGRVSGAINVSGVSSLQIYVGAAGENAALSIARTVKGGVSGGTASGGDALYNGNGYVGGGGGGLSRIVNSATSESIIVAAGGGGSGSYSGNAGGTGGSASWSSNVANGGSVGYAGSGGSYGGGGGSTTGGAGGSANGSGTAGTSGSALRGGNGGGAPNNAGGGGGGGGWFGGGGGGGDTDSSGSDAAGGGGGSNYYNSAYFSTTPSTFAADTTGSGSVTITYPNSVSITSSATGPFTYRSASPLTYSTNSIAGKMTFRFQSTPIAGCKNRQLNAGNSYAVTCSWSPSLMGPVTITMTFTPTDSQVATPSPTVYQVFVNRRTTLR
ncbi:hypothetical protein MCEMRE196_00496 [Candidatus Nanopelagicaceae bacterium]